MNKDYSELEGPIVYRVNINGTCIDYDAIVIGCDYDIGISIVSAKDQIWHYTDGSTMTLKRGQEMTCFNGETSPNPTGYRYKAMFYSTIVMIRKGVYDHHKSRKIENLVSNSIAIQDGQLKCAFK